MAIKRFKSILYKTEPEAPFQRSFPSGHAVTGDSWAGTGGFDLGSEASLAVTLLPVSEVLLIPRVWGDPACLLPCGRLGPALSHSRPAGLCGLGTRHVLPSLGHRDAGER